MAHRIFVTVQAGCAEVCGAVSTIVRVEDQVDVSEWFVGAKNGEPRVRSEIRASKGDHAGDVALLS